MEIAISNKIKEQQLFPGYGGFYEILGAVAGGASIMLHNNLTSRPPFASRNVHEFQNCIINL